jgi:hypothetical protein
MLVLAEGFLAFAKTKPGTDYTTPELEVAQVEREHLLALSAAELNVLHAKELARHEASHFFNQPAANADFREWARYDFWTLEESVALLLGKNPEKVSSKSLKHYLHSSPFAHTYEKLLKLAQRSDVMGASERLRPADVLAWANESEAVRAPAPLVELIDARETRAALKQLAEEADQLYDQPSAPLQHGLKKAALVTKYARIWRTIESDLKHANENGLQAEAKSPKHGEWLEEPALAWARRKGKLDESTPLRPAMMGALPGKVHRLKD